VTAASHRIDSAEALPFRWPELSVVDEPEGLVDSDLFESSTCPT
jgi:hypothetical protein